MGAADGKRALAGLTALVTGANGGIGAAFVDAMLAAGAARVHAAMRDPSAMPPRWRDDARVAPLTLDVTDRAQIAAAAALCGDLDLFVSNAGMTCIGPVSDKDEATARQVMEVNYFGPLMLTKALSETLCARRGGIIYILSMAAMIPPGPAPIYSASKSACAMLAAGVRADLEPRGVQVTLCFPGYVDTRMSDAFTSHKAAPEAIVAETLAAWTQGESHVFPDPFSKLVLTEMARDGARILTDPDGARRALAVAYDALAGRSPAPAHD